jgi:serine/threonine protein kinase
MVREQISSYRLESEIARGGMAIVYRGVHTVFNELVAIKAILPELTISPELRERFLKEAKIQRRLQHRNIVQIREFLIEQGNFYIVMEFVDGETLAGRLRRLGPMPAGDAIEVFRQMLEGLEFAHARDVIHRDIKPSNILVAPAGVAKITDFGIARALEGSVSTCTGTALGTPAYMSPEQVRGTKLDYRTDIYSLGVTLYEMLTGRVPFERPKDSDSDYAVLEAHVNQAPPPPRQWFEGIPAFVEAAILKALEKQPKNRFQTCGEFQAALVPPEIAPTKNVVVSPPSEEERATAKLREEAERLVRERIERARFASERDEKERLAREAAEAEWRARQAAEAKERSNKKFRARLVALTTITIGLIAAALGWMYWPKPKVQPLGNTAQPDSGAFTNSPGQSNATGSVVQPKSSRKTLPPDRMPGKSVVTSEPPSASKRASQEAAKAEPNLETAKKVKAALTEGDFYRDDGDYDRAINAYQTGLAADPGNAQLLQRIQKAKNAKATESSVPQ